MWGRPTCGVPPSASHCYIGYPSPPRLHLCRFLSQFDSRAHIASFGLYIQLCTPPLDHPETLIHNSQPDQHTPGGLGLELSNVVD
jgi:hypothetical protein